MSATPESITSDEVCACARIAAAAAAAGFRFEDEQVVTVCDSLRASVIPPRSGD